MTRSHHTTEPSGEEQSHKKTREESEDEENHDDAREKEEGKETNEERETTKKTRKVSSKTRAKSQIRKSQNSTDYCIRPGSFRRIIKSKLTQAIKDLGGEETPRITKIALALSQCVLEDHATKMLTSANYNMTLCTKGRRITLDVPDLMTAVHGNDQLRPLHTQWLEEQREELIKQKLARDIERRRIASLTKEEREIEAAKKKEISLKKREEKLRLKAKRKQEREEKEKNKQKKTSTTTTTTTTSTSESQPKQAKKRRHSSTAQVEVEKTQEPVEQQMETTEEGKEDSSATIKKTKHRSSKRSKTHVSEQNMIAV